MSQPAKLALKANAAPVVRRGLNRVVRCAALRAGIVMVIRVVTKAMVEPASDGIDQPRAIDLVNAICNGLFRVRGTVAELAPAFVVDYLYCLCGWGQSFYLVQRAAECGPKFVS